MKLRCDLFFEMGRSLKEINETDFDELMGLLAFRDAVEEFETMKHYDENTPF